MIFVCSHLESINNFWENEFNKKDTVKIVGTDFFDYEQEFTNNDILILDIDRFSNIDDLLEFYNTIPKTLKTIALLEEPKLAHGTYIIKKGFKSYIGKRTSNLIVSQAIDTVMDGNVWLYPELMNYIIKHINVTNDSKRASDKLSNLSAKELEVANLVAEGMSNKDIALKMDIQLVTVKKHISSIFTKLNIKDRVSLAILVNK